MINLKEKKKINEIHNFFFEIFNIFSKINTLKIAKMSLVCCRFIRLIANQRKLLLGNQNLNTITIRVSSRLNSNITQTTSVVLSGK
jgi:hypothetical protein